MRAYAEGSVLALFSTFAIWGAWQVPAATPVIDAVVAPLFQEKVYGGVPPDPAADAPPSKKPLHVALLSTTDNAPRAVGCVIITELVAGPQPLLSVTLTV